MAGAADLEEDAALVLELNLLVVEFARQQHAAVHCQQLIATEPLELIDGGRRIRVGLASVEHGLHAA